MDIDPMEAVEKAKEEAAERAEREQERRKSRLNNWVAVTIALLATFMGVCKIKDDNIVQAMQQAQADKLDNWNYYQARNIREEVMKATATQLEIQAKALPAANRAEAKAKAEEYRKLAAEQAQKKQEQKKAAEDADKQYNALNFHDDQFDMSDAFLAIAISILALTSLTQKRWLFAVALVPTFFGVLLGLAGLFGSQKIHFNWLAKLLS